MAAAGMVRRFTPWSPETQGEPVAPCVHRRTLYALRDAGIVEQLSRGLYRLADAPPLGNPDLVTAAR